MRTFRCSPGWPASASVATPSPASHVRAPDGTRLSELAQVTKQTAGLLVDLLERVGYAQRAPDPADARARCIACRGAAAVPIAAAAEVAVEWTRHLGTRRMAQLRRSLTRPRGITDLYRMTPG